MTCHTTGFAVTRPSWGEFHGQMEVCTPPGFLLGGLFGGRPGSLSREAAEFSRSASHSLFREPSGRPLLEYKDRDTWLGAFPNLSEFSLGKPAP
jgi:hypothetical protein